MIVMNSAYRNTEGRNPLKYVDYSGHESINEDYGYFFRTANMAVSGSFTNDFTVAGLGIQLGLGFVGADFPCDVRDFAADVTVNKDVLSLKWWGTMVIDVIAFIPVIGEVKYLDEVALGIKMAGKNGDELLAGGRQILKAAAPLGDLKADGTALDGMPEGLRGLKNADVLNDAKYADDLVDTASDVGKRLDDLADVASDAGKKLDDLAGGGTSAKGLIGHDFEDYLSQNIGGNGSFSVGGRDFDGDVGNRWWEAKSGNYWKMLEETPSELEKFKSDMGARLRIATENGATYELFSNTPIPESIKQWLIKKGIPFTELSD